MRCSKAREQISDALDDRLDEGRAIELSGHLDDCADCQRHQEVLTEGRALLRQELVEPSENFEWKVQLKIQQALREKAAGPEPVSGWAFWRPALASASAVALVVLMAGGVLLSSPDDAERPGTPVRASMRVAESAPSTSQPDLSGGVRRQPLRINAATGGFGIRTVADQGFVNRSPFPDPATNDARWRQESPTGTLEVRRVVGADGEVYYVVHRLVAPRGASLNLDLHRSTLQEGLPVLPVGDAGQDPDS